jgi:serine protease inhibitor
VSLIESFFCTVQERQESYFTEMYELPEEFICDRPFLFMILTEKKRPIFIGHYVGPNN